ncbi:MAG: hypothetical protein AAGC46_06010 [Solirubrobacteraceae bacterium]
MAKDPEPDADGDDEDTGSAKVHIAGHPRAMRSIARVRAWGALIGFGVALYFGHKAGLTFVELMVRAILIGAAGYLVAWAGAQGVWRQIIFAELAARRTQALEIQKTILDELEHPERIDQQQG